MNMTVPAAPDYTKEEAWLCRPAVQDKEADVFFLHGTVLEGEGCCYLDPALERHRLLPLRPRYAHASVYEKAANLFIPHYRQVSMEAHLEDRDVLDQMYEVPVADAEAAFLEYWKNWNHGRPFILAGNSQGAILALELLRRLIKNPEYQKNLVAAYIIGFTVTEQDLAECGMPLACAADDTGCIITYNTLANGGNAGLTLMPGALCVNPLNWTNGTEYAPKEQNLGRVDFEGDKIVLEIPHFTDAWIDRNVGALMVGVYTKESAPPREFFPQGDRHSFNYAYFYRNLEVNACQRVRSFLQK